MNIKVEIRLFFNPTETVLAFTFFQSGLISSSFNRLNRFNFLCFFSLLDKVLLFQFQCFFFRNLFCECDLRFSILYNKCFPCFFRIIKLFMQCIHCAILFILIFAILNNGYDIHILCSIKCTVQKKTEKNYCIVVLGINSSVFIYERVYF